MTAPHPAAANGNAATTPNRRLRRMAASKKASRTNPVLRDHDFTSTAFDRLQASMRSYGNVLSEAHRAALYAVVGRFTMLANGAASGRFAYDLPCGGGKTQAVIAWCAEMVLQNKPWSVAVSASRVADLCDIKRQLLEVHGVPESAVGIVHSYGDAADYPPTTGNDERPILLVTHNRVRGTGAARRIETYQGRPRSFVIWDESLIAAEHRAIERVQLEQGLGWLKPLAEGFRSGPDLVEAVRYLETAWAVLAQEFERQGSEGRGARAVDLPELEPDALERLLSALPDQREADAPRDLLRISQGPIRAAKTNQGGGGVVTYEVVVPRDLANVAVLDASWAIRDLERLDRSIRDDPAFVPYRNFKNFGNVTVNHLRTKSGRTATVADFLEPREGRKLSREIVEVVKGLPTDEGVLIFTFKPKATRRGNAPLDMAETLRGDLEAAGIDTAATLPDGRSRFAWLTWGQETAVSTYAYCRNVIFAGVLHRSDADLAGAMIGQSDNLLRPVSTMDIQTVRRSEVAHGLYQAMNRGACRTTENGEAGRMRVWLPHRDKKVREVLDTVMPGLVWTEWRGEVLEGATSKEEDLADKINGYLNGLSREVFQMSTRKMKQEVDAGSAARMTWTRALRRALDSRNDWTMSGRSVIRSEGIQADL